ncbi:intradiol ring-cleavage dioxygenase [Chryseobacterium sediminis]|uniref:dioxygenase family protein n=1 Tax=Chryseobacterium sediminis TaxID=1679494 RepID=UPI00285E3031|nr:intradiol ring-cleavage dioxygenase [Chryseobacterium sediminis]MDR6465597.1 protocatechuate 3,4-dioxygenase beta subunit [Chryseobacterium sediminis]
MKTMNRKGFLKSLGLAGVTAVAAPLLIHCGSDDDVISSSSGTSTESGSTGCSVTNTETEGPFPTKSPSTLVQNNIVSDRTGVPFTIAITVQNVNASCAILQGALVDIWHCDKDGNYSEYGGTGMQSANYTSVHFLRGRQTTDANGQVSFTSIFPGWYNGRATHIHVHVYNSAGQSLLVTQIAFPEGSDSAVVQVAASTGYKGMNGYTYNANDNVFGDGTSNEMSNISGSVSGGFALTHTIKVSA